MKLRLPSDNELFMLILIAIMTAFLFFGCGSSVKELEHKNAMQFQAAVKVIAFYMAKADSMEEGWEKCRNIKELRVKK